MKSVVFEGTIKTVSPVLVMLPEPKGAPRSADKSPKHPKAPVVVGDMVVEVPIIPGNTLRGALRRHLAFSILSKFRDLDYLTVTFLTCGGVIDPKDENKISLKPSETFDYIEKLKEKNVIASLFGGSLPIVKMIKGSLLTEFAWAKVGEVYDGYPYADDIILKNITFAKLDETLRNYDIYSILSEEGKAELEKRFQSKKERVISGEEKSNGKKQTEAETANIIGSLGDAVAPNVEFSHRIELTEPTERNLGAVLYALKMFAENDATIGGHVRFGFGKVIYEYRVYETDGSTKKEIGGIKGGWSRFEDQCFCRFCEINPSLMPFLNVFNDYFNKLKKEDIAIIVPKGKKAKDSEDKE